MHKQTGIRPLASLSIRQKLFLLRIGIGVCMGLVIGAAAVWMAVVVLYGFARGELQTTGHLVSVQAGQALDGAGHELAEVAESEEMEKYFHSGRPVVLSTLFRRYADVFDHLVLFDYEGTPQAAMIRGQFGDSPGVEQQSDGFVKAVQTPNTLIVQGIVQDRALGEPVVQYYYNHVDYFDNPMGILTGCVPLTSLEAYLEKRFTRSEMLALVVADKNGAIAFGPTKGDAGKLLPAVLKESGTDGQLPEAGEYLGRHEVFGASSLVSVHPVPGLEWRIFVMKPTALIHRPLYMLFGLIFLVTALTTLLSEFISRSLGIRIVEPVDRLIRVISDILESGNLTQRVEWASRDEMGTLAGLFNAMLEKIDAEQIELQARRTRELEEEVLRRKEDQARLRKAIADAEDANRTKSEFLANMSHEIRTPMNGIMGMVELALDSGLDRNQEQLVSAISTEADSLLSIINSILDFSKIESGKLELERVNFNLRDLFEDLAATFALTARKKGLEFIAFMPPDTPVLLTGDPARLRQILVNLVGNAIKFTHKGEVCVRVDLWEKTHTGVQVRFSIEDTGIGIPENSRAVVFDSFSQADSSTTRKYGGTGLGTTISKQLVQMMGGQIGFDSRPAGGTRFWFTARFEMGPAAKVSEENATAPLLPRSLRVLVAEGNPRACSTICSYVEAFGATALPAGDAETAMEFLSGEHSRENAVDLVLADIRLPGRRAPCFVSELPYMDKVPLVCLSFAHEIWNLPEKGAFGPAVTLSKPVRLAEIGAVVAAVAENRPMAGLKALRGEGNPRNRLSLKSVQILLAEDYPTNQQVALRHLTNAGFTVKLAEDGVQAVALFREQRFDLVLMDIQMPVMDGYEAARKIRQAEAELERSEKNRVPVIAMTAHAVKGYRQKCLDAGMDDYVTKPLKRRELIRMVEKWTAGGTGTESPQAENDHRTVPPAATSSGAPVDMARAMTEFENDTAFFLKVLGVFMGSLENRMALLRAAVETDDFKTVREQAHTIKGAAANMAAMDLYEAAVALEACGENRERDAVERSLALVEAEVGRLKAFREGV